jgi:hypothetical protein
VTDIRIPRLSDNDDTGTARFETMAFHADRTAETPLTWGQLALWAAIQRTRPADQYFNYSRVLDVGGHRADAVLDALAAVVTWHEALRTRLCDDDGPDPIQRVHDSGAYDVERVDAAGDPDAVAAAISARFNARPFDYRNEWPVRVAIVSDGDDDAPARLVLGFCHLAVDGAGSQIVLDDIVHALAGTPLAPAPQPVELAADQRSDAGRRAAAAALRHWERGLRRIPPTMFGDPVARAQELPFWTGEIASPALGRALAATAERTGISNATVMFAASAALTAELAGHDLCAMLVIVMNRFRPERHRMVSTLALEGLVVVDVERSGSFDALLHRAWGASLAGFRSAEYPEAGRDEVTARVSRDRGVAVHPYCCYNDVRGPDATSDADGDGPTVFGWTRKLPKIACRFCLHVHGDGPAGFRVALTADTRYVPPENIERYLYGMERLVVASAAGDVPLDGLGGMLRP